jgi:hypothetical protein
VLVGVLVDLVADGGRVDVSHLVKVRIRRAPSSLTPKTMHPPPALAKATTSFTSSHQSPVENGSNSALKSRSVASPSAEQAFKIASSCTVLEILAGH